MYEKECFEGILLCEDADEHIKGFVRWCNENTPVQIWLMSVLCFEGKYVEFVPLIRPSAFKDKKIRRVKSESSNYSPDFTESLEQKAEENPGLFTNVRSRYLSTNGVGGSGINVGISPRKSGYFMVTIWHAGKWNNDKFRNSFNEYVKNETMLEPKWQDRQAYVNVDSWDEGLEIYKKFINGLKTKKIVG